MSRRYPVTDQERSGPARSLVHEAAYRGEKVVDRIRSRFRRPPREVNVVPFIGHGTRDRVVVGGRVLSSAPIDPDVGREPVWRRARRMAARFLTSEISGVEIGVELEGGSARAVSDDEGYFTVDFAPGPIVAERLFHEVDFAVLDAARFEVHIGPARVMVPSTKSARLVISDIDDTVLQTGAMSTARMVATTMTGSAWTRDPFGGVARLYAGLSRGPELCDDNPFFYVSSSPWNLYDFLTAFLARAVLPTGPLFLRDLGVDETRFLKGTHSDHKRRAIEEILDVHDLPAVLVGDTGQHDPEIYRSVVEDHGDRIEAVLLRHVAGPERLSGVRAMLEEAQVPHAVSPDSLQLCRAAEDLGLVAPHWSDRLV